MEPHQNVAIMQRAYEAFNTGGMNTLTELMDETVWHLPGRSSMAGDYQGSGATLAYFGQLAQETEGTFRAELQHMAVGRGWFLEEPRIRRGYRWGLAARQAGSGVGV